MQAPPPLTILIAEDDPADFAFIESAIKDSGFPTKIHWAPDGAEARDYLQGARLYADRTAFPAPDLVLLDVKMPRMSGIEVLEWISVHPQYRVIPTLIMSSSALVRDIQRAYDLGATTYFVKPIPLNEFREIFRTITAYWSYGITTTRLRKMVAADGVAAPA